MRNSPKPSMLVLLFFGNPWRYTHCQPVKTHLLFEIKNNIYTLHQYFISCYLPKHSYNVTKACIIIISNSFIKIKFTPWDRVKIPHTFILLSLIENMSLLPVIVIIYVGSRHKTNSLDISTIETFMTHNLGIKIATNTL